MSVHFANIGTLCLAIALGIGLVALSADHKPRQGVTHTMQQVAQQTIVVRDGDRGLLDATGTFIPLKNYQRIISLSSVADGLLYALAEPERIRALSPYSDTAAFAFRYSGFKSLSMKFDTELLLSYKPDLVITHHLSRPDRVAKLRDGGLTIVDLGEMKGLETLLPNIHTVATLLGHPERGVQLARQVRERLATIAKPGTERPAAIYAGIHGDKMYGGTRGTSYHDVLQAAGLRDIAADRYEGWTRYTPEHLLQLNPQIIVTQRGMTQRLCGQSGLAQLRACSPNGQVVEVETALLLNPGLTIVEAAEAVHRQVFGPRN